MIMIVKISSSHTDSLPDVEILAKDSFLFNGDQSPLMFSWEEYGLQLHVSERSTASFKVRVVNPRTFEIPEGTELLSPFYWVTSEGDTAGPVGVEIQHCARITEEGLSGLGVAMHEVYENRGSPYRFKEVAGHLSSNSGYARMEVQFSDRILALFKTFFTSTKSPIPAMYRQLNNVHIITPILSITESNHIISSILLYSIRVLQCITSNNTNNAHLRVPCTCIWLVSLICNRR